MINIFTEVNKNITEEIKNGTYNFFSIGAFFGINDFIRLIKILYFLINVFLNILILISIKKTKKKKFSIALKLTGNILIVNFIHTFSYAINWVTNTDEDHAYKMIIDDKYLHYIGGLLIGNPTNHYWVCKTQSFLMLFSSISQDLVIIIFFYLINKTKLPTKKSLKIITGFFVYFIPFIITFIYLSLDCLGLNERYCYIKEFDFSETSGYSINSKYKTLITIIYIIRGINLIISIYLIIKIIIYINTYRIKKLYILKSSFFLIAQTATITIGLIFRISHIIVKDNNRLLSNIFLIINTIDGVLFPLYFCLSNRIFGYIFCNKMHKHNSLITVKDDEDVNNNNSNINSSKDEKDYVMLEIKDDNNNFEISYQ
jgi:hypothetical protein